MFATHSTSAPPTSTVREIAAVDQHLRQAERDRGGGAGGGHHPGFAADAERVGHRLAEAVELGLQVHPLVERPRALAVLPGVLRLAGAQAAVAGAQHQGDVRARASAGRSAPRRPAGPAGRRRRRSAGRGRRTPPARGRPAPAPGRGGTSPPRLVRKKLASNREIGTMPCRPVAQRLGDRLRVVADRAQDADPGDRGLVLDTLPAQRLADHLRAVLPGRRLEVRGVALLLALEELAPDVEELLAQLLGRHVQRAGDDVGAVVVRPVAVDDAPLALHAVPVRRARVRREDEELGGVDAGGVEQVEDPVGDARRRPSRGRSRTRRRSGCRGLRSP